MDELVVYWDSELTSMLRNVDRSRNDAWPLAPNVRPQVEGRNGWVMLYPSISEDIGSWPPISFDMS
jgi:hypothetical protein